MDLSRLEKVLESEPAFRLSQIKRAVFIDLVDDWLEVLNLPLPLRQKLNQLCPLDIEAKILFSKDKTSVKAAITLTDGLKIEAVLLNHRDGRHTACLSSQAGCTLGCLFCATGRMGFKRNLTSGEIVEQVLFFERWLKKNNPPTPLYSLDQLGTGKGGNRVNNVVFMGMGEPLLNYDNVMAAIKIINDKSGLNIGARHISLSTIGITDGLKKLAKEKLQLNLAWSLHAPNDKLRSELIPANKRYSIRKVMAEINNYLNLTKRRVMIEYLMIDGFNDSKELARELADLLKQIDPPLFFVNLIAYNPTADFRPSPINKIKDFKLVLNKQGLEVTERYRFGREIKAACGQLAGKL